jgi:3D (Asp-Asp-Asp) domain-containing protein
VVPLTIHVDGQALAVFSPAATVAEALARAGIAVSETDIVTPPRDQLVVAGAVIEVVRSGEELLVEDEIVPFQTIYQPTDTLDLDSKELLSSGVPGILRRSVRVRYENGVEVSREVEGEWFEQEPVNEVIGYGTRITTNVIDTPEGPREYWRVVRMRATAYTASSSGKSPDHPSYGITASGLPAGTGIVAVDPNVIPFRSEVYVPGYGIGFAGDTGGGVKGRWIDLGYDEDELKAWNGYVDVYYLSPVPAEINYLLPEVLP